MSQLDPTSFPVSPQEAYRQLRELVASGADNLRQQSARDRARLERQLASRFPAGLVALRAIDMAVDFCLSRARHAWHLAGRAGRRALARSRSTWATVDQAVARRLDDHAQHHVAHGLLAATAALAMLATLVGMSGHPTRPQFQIDRTADGRAVTQEAIARPKAPAAAPVEPAPTVPAAAAPAPIVAPTKGALPVGKGMWLYLPERVEAGNVDATVARAKAVGLTHLYVRTGSSKSGFYAGEYLDRLLPKAHAAGIRVYGWDFPYLDNPGDDVNRAMAAILHEAPGGHRIDGFSADIELRSMGVNISAETATYYGENLRRLVGPGYPLIATVPRPSPALRFYPFPEVVQHFDAIAPMVYWMNRDPAVDVGGAMDNLSQFGKPVIPIGQAYDGFAEGGPPGVPSAAQIKVFMQVAEEKGAAAVSFWSWQHADQQAWDAIAGAPFFNMGVAPDLSMFQIRAYQHLLRSMGYTPGATGQLDQPTTDAVRHLQRARGLEPTGTIDAGTRDALLAPYASPIGGG
jgi:hypothetical protein